MSEKSYFSRRDFIFSSAKGAVGATLLSSLPHDGFTRNTNWFSAIDNKGDDELITIIDQQRSDWGIASLTAGEKNRFACEEIGRYLFQMASTQLNLENNPEHTDFHHKILVGLRDEIPQKYRQLLPPPDGGYDGYSIVAQKDIPLIVIAGENKRGTLYGAYHFLEILGCRWYYPQEDPNDREVVPAISKIAFPVISLFVSSPLKYRICNGDGWYWDMDYVKAVRQIDWAMKNRYNMIGWQGATSFSRRSLLQQYKDLEDAGVTGEMEKRGMTIHGPAHSFDQFLNSDEYFEGHPEWFGMLNGKRVPYSTALVQFDWSNKEAREKFIDNAENFILNAPLVQIFMTIPFDGGVACDCEDCRREGPSNLLMILIGELIERLAKSRPDVIVESIGGYGPATAPPENIRVIHPRMRIGWAQWGRYHGYGYDDSRYNKDNLEQWRKAAISGMTIVQYYTDNFAEPWVMGPFTTAMVSDRRYILQNNIDGLYMLMYPPGYWWNHALNGYLAGRMFYDVSLAPGELIDDFALNYFGKDAGPLISKYYKEWADNIDLSYRVRDGATREDAEILARQRRDWIDPAFKKTRDDKRYHYRVNKVVALHCIAEKLTAVQVLKARIRQLRQKGNFKQAGKELEKARISADQAMLALYSTAGLGQGLIEIKEVPGFIKMGVQGWTEDEEKRISSGNRD